MFDVKTLCDEIRDLANRLDSMLDTASVIPSKSDMLALNNVGQIVDAIHNKVLAKYSQRGDWAQDGYLSGKTAIVHETGLTRKTVETTLSHGELLRQFPIIFQSLRNNEITSDHIERLVPLSREKYLDFFVDDHELLVETAKTLSAQQFCNVVRHWKSMVDALIDEPSDEYKAFEKRHLFLNELLDGSWLIHGELDPVTGKILHKALSGISQKLWNETSSEKRSDYTPAQQRADAIGYLAQSWISDPTIYSAPTLNTDIVIDSTEVTPDTKTHEFLKRCVENKSTLFSGHSQAFVEQLLCDTSLQVPIRSDNNFNLGRKVRTAPWHMKKQLMFESQTCTIPGCTIPSNWCDAHHITHWADGGATSIDNLALLCRRHHTMVHNDKTFANKVAETLQLHNSRKPDKKPETQHEEPPMLINTS